MVYGTGAVLGDPIRYRDIPLVEAVKSSNLIQVEELLEQGHDVNQVGIFGETPLVKAIDTFHHPQGNIKENARAILDLLLGHADLLPNQPANMSEIGYRDEGNGILRMTVDGGVKDKRKRKAHSAAVLAARDGDIQTLMKLVSRGADLKREDEMGIDVALTAIRYGRKEVLKYLHEEGVDLSSEKLMEAAKGSEERGLKGITRLLKRLR